jgi:hypothetical protein
MKFFPRAGFPAAGLCVLPFDSSKLFVFCAVVAQKQTHRPTQIRRHEGKSLNPKPDAAFVKKFPTAEGQISPLIADPADLSAWFKGGPGKAKCFIFRLWTVSGEKIFPCLL